MGKRSKSKRFIHQGAASVKKHAEVFTYRSTLSDEERKHEEVDNHNLGGF
ncbi:hypothetical protein [Oceanobacillus profundus]|nr:hypothetical protein [Oceanobacillus profundus]MBR3119108.1 hypothetical protein [Oceanobacillus sp.]MCM3399234.1 hypothetical protein [Oceanobacillus profundus]MDO6449266.1 hypothetical protein [Oceanobacillus profundus]